jgi:glycine betaine/choline ABC-type transport system substrate-binding protein
MTGLAKRSEKSLVLISDQEFFYRNEWFGLQERYNLKFADVEYVKHNTVYERVKTGISETLGIVGVGFGSDAELNVADLELIKIEDDKGVFPHYHPAPLVDKLLLKKFPAIEPALNKLKGIMSIEEMSMLLEDHRRLMSKAADGEAKVELTEYLARVFLDRKGVLVKQ